jgi:hypothetical protein
VGEQLPAGKERQQAHKNVQHGLDLQTASIRYQRG